MLLCSRLPYLTGASRVTVFTLPAAEETCHVLEKQQHLLTNTLPIAYYRLYYCRINVQTTNVFLCSARIPSHFSAASSLVYQHTQYTHISCFLFSVCVCLLQQGNKLFFEKRLQAARLKTIEKTEELGNLTAECR